MTLGEIIRSLAALPDDHRIYAERVSGHWAARSPATVAPGDSICTLTTDGRLVQVVHGKPWEYVLQVGEAKDALSFLEHCLGGVQPSAQQQLDAIVYYGDNRNYLPIGRYYEEEHAEPVDTGVEWDPGAPLPFLLANDYRTMLAFYLRTDAVQPIGLDVHVRDPVEDTGRRIAVVEFEACRASMLGWPDVDGLRRHRLWRRGLRPHGAFIVRNSVWAAQLRALERPERARVPATPGAPDQRGGMHYLFAFRDSTFECVADALSVRVSDLSMARVVREMAEEVLTGP